ncbi:MAG: hypothetical protein WDO18_21050 [Acidobacteriota bacterium]
MSCYISSNNNRVFVALETTYGAVGAITGANRIPLLKLGAKQVPEHTGRRDKTGSRTFPGLPNRVRKDTTFRFEHTDDGVGECSRGSAAWAVVSGGVGRVAADIRGRDGGECTDDHADRVQCGARVGGGTRRDVRRRDAIRHGGSEFDDGGNQCAVHGRRRSRGSVLGATVTYPVATDLAGVSVFDFWDPAEAVQRILNGSAMDLMKVKVNGDLHEFEFSGPARDLLDSASFETGQASLSEFPAEPASIGFDYTVVPGHLGQVWMGSTPTEMHAITAAELKVDNHIDLRAREFGSDFAHCIAAGQRSVRLDFRVFAQDEAETVGLYQAARQRSPIGVMLQLGEAQGQLFGAYMPAMVPEVPEFLDGETRLEWSFANSQAQGTVNDELYVAFG